MSLRELKIKKNVFAVPSPFGVSFQLGGWPTSRDNPLCAMSVAELLARLSELPGDMPIVALYDCGTAGGSVVRVEIGPGPDDECESVILSVE